MKEKKALATEIVHKQIIKKKERRESEYVSLRMLIVQVLHTVS